MSVSGKNTARSVHKVLSGRGPLQTLAEHCARLDRLSALVAEHMPEPLNRHCRVANVADGTLVLYSDGAGWTTRLRFHAPHLLDRLRGHPELGHLREVRVRQAPPEPPPAPETLRIPYLPACAAAHLRAAAATMPSPALRAALLRLAARGAADPDDAR